jgi:hypothetical protein
MGNFSFAFNTADAKAIKFEAMVQRFGQGDARKAFARAMNHEGAKAHTVIKRKLRQQTSINTSHINKAVSFHRAGKQTLKTITRGTGAALPLRYFGARQFKYGVRAKIWGRGQRFPGAFIVNSIAGNVFKNTRGFNKKSGRNNAIEKLWGPSIPKEMMKPAVVDAFHGATGDVATRAMHELNRILNS